MTQKDVFAEMVLGVNLSSGVFLPNLLHHYYNAIDPYINKDNQKTFDEKVLKFEPKIIAQPHKIIGELNFDEKVMFAYSMEIHEEYLKRKALGIHSGFSAYCVCYNIVRMSFIERHELEDNPNKQFRVYKGFVVTFGK